MLLNEILEPIDTDEIERALEPFLQFIASGKELSRKSIANKLEKTLKRFGVEEVTIDDSDKIDPGDMNINAAYDPDDDEEGLDPFYLELLFSTNDKTISFDTQGVSNIKERLLDALEHEMIHMQQYRRRDFAVQRSYRSKSKDPNLSQAQEYLGNEDEIEAFAKNIASELIRKADKDGAIDLLRMANKTAQFRDKVGHLLSPNLFGYLATWDFDSTHPVIKKLLKKVYNYIQSS